MGRAVPAIASAGQLHLEFLVPAYLRGMPLLKGTGTEVSQSRADWSVGTGRACPLLCILVLDWNEPSFIPTLRCSHFPRNGVIVNMLSCVSQVLTNC